MPDPSPSMVAGASVGAGRSDTVREECELRAWSRKSQMVCWCVRYRMTSLCSGLTIVSRRVRKRVSTPGPVVSIMGTASVGMVPTTSRVSKGKHGAIILSVLPFMLSLGGGHVSSFSCKLVQALTSGRTVQSSGELVSPSRRCVGQLKPDIPLPWLNVMIRPCSISGTAGSLTNVNLLDHVFILAVALLPEAEAGHSGPDRGRPPESVSTKRDALARVQLS